MLKNGYISSPEKEKANQTALPSKQDIKHCNGYFHYVFDELTDIATNNNLTLGGKIEIFTGLDAHLQEYLETLSMQAIDCNKTFMVLNPHNGMFKACASDVGNISRLPGSLIKPLLVYAPALEENILVPATPILDEKVNYSGYSPQNYDNQYHGYVSARECLAKSLNVPAVKVLQSIGLETATHYMDKMGLSVPSEDQSLALALGGMKRGFTLRDVTSAYQPLQNGGDYQKAAFISKIRINGQAVYTRPEKKNNIFSNETSYLITDMLKTAVSSGTAKKLRSLPFEIAAKTGTVGSKNGNTDAYALSYTTNDIVSVWLGNADNHPMKYTGGGLPCSYLTQINQHLYEDYLSNAQTISPFAIPKGIVKVSLDKKEYYDMHNILLADDLAPVDYRFEELFNKAHLPTKKSFVFSNPSIATPSVKYDGHGITITLDKDSPTFYKYKIDRYDYVTHTTVYFGEYQSTITDTNIKQGKKYLYTITPLFNEKIGTPITLPMINTASSPKNPITSEEWWTY